MRLGTRGSRLALAQARLAAAALARAGAGSVEVVAVTTLGDRVSAERPRGRFETTDGQFTGELERGLLRGDLDLAVHSHKDLPTMGDERLLVAAVLERDDARDCLLPVGLEALPPAARVGTSSPRRAAQLAEARPDLVALPIRGNVESRIARLERGEYDGIVVAAAGLNRLGIEYPDAALLGFHLMLPAPAQGALAIQARAVDRELLALLATLDHSPTRVAVDAERALLRAIGGGCLAPLGAFGQVRSGVLTLRAAYDDGDGRVLRVAAEGPADNPAAVVADAATRLRATAEAVR